VTGFMRHSEVRETVNVNVVRKRLLYVRSIRRIMRKHRGVHVRRQHPLETEREGEREREREREREHAHALARAGVIRARVFM